MTPGDLSTKSRREWDYKEAKAYFSWMMSVKEERVDYLLSFLRVKKTADNGSGIKELGDKVYGKLMTEPFSELVEEKRTITKMGLALVADLSLFISERLLEKHDKINGG